MIFYHDDFLLGTSDEGQRDPLVPFLCVTVAPNTPYDWNYTTTPQVGLGGRSITYQRGHILGGSSSISELFHFPVPLQWLIAHRLDYMFYTRGSQDDYNRYAQITGDNGWSWNNLQPYFRKVNDMKDGHVQVF